MRQLAILMLDPVDGFDQLQVLMLGAHGLDKTSLADKRVGDKDSGREAKKDATSHRRRPVSRSDLLGTRWTCGPER